MEGRPSPRRSPRHRVAGTPESSPGTRSDVAEACLAFSREGLTDSEFSSLHDWPTTPIRTRRARARARTHEAVRRGAQNCRLGRALQATRAASRTPGGVGLRSG
jgi:hypothetical protein